MKKLKFFEEFNKKLLDKESLTDIIKGSSLDKDLKETIIDRIDITDDEEEIICDLDDCLDFLKRQGFKTWNLSEEEDIKLENYLKKYFSENLKNFPNIIITEDSLVIYAPNRKYNFTKEQLPTTLSIIKNDLYTIHLSLTSVSFKHSSQNFSSKPIEMNKCEEIKKIFLDKDFRKLQSLYHLFNDTKINFDIKIKMIIKDISDFTLYEPQIKKATQEEIYKELEADADKYNL